MLKPGERARRIDQVIQAMLCMQRQCWEQGICSQALLELGRTDLVILFAKEAVTRQDESGRLGIVENTPTVTDPAALGEAVLAAARLTGDPGLAAAVSKMTQWFLERAPRSGQGIFYHLRDARQIWSDSFCMTPPFLAAVGLYGEALHQIRGLRELLWDPRKKLYSHIWDDECQDFARREFWGGGNGWAAAGLTRVIRLLPETMAVERIELAGYLRELLDGCLNHQRRDGYFHDILDNPDSFVEANLGQMLAYSIYRGIKGGWIDPGNLAAAEQIRGAAYQKVDQYGLVQDVCGSPRFDRPGTSSEGQAFFLLMEAAALDLEEKREQCELISDKKYNV